MIRNYLCVCDLFLEILSGIILVSDGQILYVSSVTEIDFSDFRESRNHFTGEKQPLIRVFGFDDCGECNKIYLSKFCQIARLMQTSSTLQSQPC